MKKYNIKPNIILKKATKIHSFSVNEKNTI